MLESLKWSYDPRSYERNFTNCVEKPENFRVFNEVWTRDLTMAVRRSSKLSYEATDGESSSSVNQWTTWYTRNEKYIDCRYEVKLPSSLAS